MPIQRNTLPSAIRSTSSTAIGFVAIVRKREGRSRSTPVVDGTPGRLPGNRRADFAQVPPSLPVGRNRQGAPMRFKLMRGRGGRDRVAGGDAAAVADVLERAAREDSSDPGGFELALGTAELLERPPTDDLRALVRDGVDEDE